MSIFAMGDAENVGVENAGGWLYETKNPVQGLRNVVESFRFA